MTCTDNSVIKKIAIFEGDYFPAVILSIFTTSLFFINIYVSIASALFITFTIAFIIYKTCYKKERLQKPEPIVYLWLSVYLVRVIWLSISSDPMYGLRWMDSCLPMVLFPLAFQYFPLSERTIKWALTFFTRFSFIFCLITIISIAYHIYTGAAELEEWVRNPKNNYFLLAYAWTNYQHPSFLCVVYLLSLPTGLYLYFKYRNISAIEWVLLYLSVLFVVYFTGARIGILIFIALSALMILYIFLRKKNSKSIGSYFILSSISVIFLSLAFATYYFQDNFDDPIRKQLWKTAVYSIKEKPLLGVGTGGMMDVLTSPEVAKKLGYSEAYDFSPHNQYLAEIMYFGIIGALPLFITLVYLLITSLRRRYFLLQSLLVITFLFMITDMALDISKSLNLILFFSSFFIAMNQSKKVPA
jgi:O-antigen ligase